MRTVAYAATILFLMAMSFLFSGSETGVYRLSRFRLRLGVEQKRQSYRRLFQLIQDGQNVILSILLGNNLVNYLMTFLFTYIVWSATQNEAAAELYSSLILTPAVFIFCEMMPKSIFYYKSDSLMPALSWFLTAVYSFFKRSGLLQLFKLVFAGINRLIVARRDTVQAVDTTQRLLVFQILHETQEEGLLSDVQKDMIHRLIHIPDISVSSVMIPIAQFPKVPLNAERNDLLALLQQRNSPRYLVYDMTPEQIVGSISLPRILAGSEFTGLGAFVEPLPCIDHSASVIEAISLLRKERKTMALVTDQSKQKVQPAGVLTTTDLIEELIGEVAKG